MKGKTSIVSAILSKTADFFEVDMNDLISQSRKQDLVTARQFFYYYGYVVELISYEKLAAVTNRKEHSTALWGKNTIEGLLEVDPAVRRKYQAYVEFIEQVYLPEVAA